MDFFVLLQEHSGLIQMIIATVLGGLVGGVTTKKALAIAATIVAMVAKESLNNQEKRDKAVEMFYQALPQVANRIPRFLAVWIIEVTWQGLVKAVVEAPKSPEG